ncbi:hypothetical protein F7725_010650 [Dissostichus mawsoni]|uniref:Peroxisome proliferator-activated receptor gamma coactivator 1-beta n=1 Tax=Dissostichus mawsoni TaxID=36200 RepID=A0A7J5XP67_DISMA|nr:hypothetical protein F7725_010650 [Dissostichus mawsoni]
MLHTSSKKMADCAPLLDEELSSFVFSYLTETSGSQYGEEEVCSDRLDNDFPDIDLSQLDTSDFDSVNCLSELQWCNDQPSDRSPASINYSTTDELLDGMVDAEVGGLSVFPVLGEEPNQEEEDEDNLSLSAEDFSQSLGSETEDPSLVQSLRLNSGKTRGTLRYSSRSLRTVKPLVKEAARRPSVRRLCTELHKHLTTARDTEEDKEEEEEEEDEEEEESESEEEDEDEEEESSSSEVEGGVVAVPPPKEGAALGGGSDHLHAHLLLLPIRKQQGWDQRKEAPRPRARNEAPRPPLTPTAGWYWYLLQQSSSYDVSKPYGLQTPPYVHSPSRTPSRGGLRARRILWILRILRTAALFRFVAPVDSPRSRVASARGFGQERRGKESWGGRKGKKGRRRERESSAADTNGRSDDDDGKADGRRTREQTLLPQRESQYSSKPFEQTLGVDLCGTAGLTPPTTPPHKPVEDELFKPSEAGKPSDVVGVSTKASSSWLSRAHPPRKLPEQTELYAQLRRMGQAGANESYRTFGDHDYCALSLGESRKRSADMLCAILQAQSGGMDGSKAPKNVDDQGSREREREREEVMVASQIAELLEQQITTTTTKTTRKLVISSLPPPSHCQSATATPPVSEEEAERSENSEICPDDKQRNKAKSDEDNCQVFYIHNLPTSVTQNMLRKRFQVFGKPEDCKNAPAGLKRLTRKRYIDLDEAGPGPVKSKYDALDFDTLLKEAQKSLHR